MYKLLGFTTEARQKLIASDADVAVKVAFCSRKLLKYGLLELAIAALLDA
jgi:hypothetical protein